MPFELLDPITATLTSVTSRVERHGEEQVPAISLGLKITTANTILDRLHKTLRQTFYQSANDVGQPSLNGVEESTPLLRQPGIEEVKLKGELNGWTLLVDYGVDEGDPLELGACKVDHFRMTPLQGGTVDLCLRIGTSDIGPDEAGILWSQNGQEISIRLIAPKPQAPAIDGTVGHPKATDGVGQLFEGQPDDATDAFLASQAVTLTPPRP